MTERSRPAADPRTLMPMPMTGGVAVGGGGSARSRPMTPPAPGRRPDDIDPRHPVPATVVPPPEGDVGPQAGNPAAVSPPEPAPEAFATAPVVDPDPPQARIEQARAARELHRQTRVIAAAGTAFIVGMVASAVAVAHVRDRAPAQAQSVAAVVPGDTVAAASAAGASFAQQISPLEAHVATAVARAVMLCSATPPDRSACLAAADAVVIATDAARNDLTHVGSAAEFADQVARARSVVDGIGGDASHLSSALRSGGTVDLQGAGRGLAARIQALTAALGEPATPAASG